MYGIEIDVAGFCPGTPFVVIASAHSFPLTCERMGDEIVVRAATGEEVTETLTTGLAEEGDDLDWPGDPPQRMSIELIWQERPPAEPEEDPAVQLWSGEVFLRSGKGVAGPFYVHQMAAIAWAASTALRHSEGDVFECQVVPYLCARRVAPALLRHGETEYDRL